MNMPNKFHIHFNRIIGASFIVYSKITHELIVWKTINRIQIFDEHGNMIETINDYNLDSIFSEFGFTDAHYREAITYLKKFVNDREQYHTDMMNQPSLPMSNEDLVNYCTDEA